MKFRLEVPLVFAAVLLIVSCTTMSTSVESKKDQEYTKLVDRIYLVVDTGESKLSGTKGTFGDYLNSTMPQTLAKEGVETKAKRLTGLELSKEQFQNEVQTEMKDFGTNTILAVQLSEGFVNSSGQLCNGVLDFSVTDTEINRTVWRAKVKVEAGKNYLNASIYNGYAGNATPIGASDVDGIVARVLNAMRGDGLIK